MMPGKKPASAMPEQHPDDEEAGLAPHEGGAAGDQAPGEHDPRDPFARPDPFQEQVRRDLEEEVGQEEDAGGEAVRRGGEVQVLVHGQRGEADVDPIQVGDEITDDQEWHEPGRHFGDGLALEWVHRIPLRSTGACDCDFEGRGFLPFGPDATSARSVDVPQRSHDHHAVRDRRRGHDHFLHLVLRDFLVRAAGARDVDVPVFVGEVQPAVGGDRRRRERAAAADARPVEALAGLAVVGGDDAVVGAGVEHPL